MLAPALSAWPAAAADFTANSGTVVAPRPGTASAIERARIGAVRSKGKDPNRFADGCKKRHTETAKTATIGLTLVLAQRYLNGVTRTALERWPAGNGHFPNYAARSYERQAVRFHDGSGLRQDRRVKYEVLNTYVQYHRIEPGWLFLVGKPADSEVVRRRPGFVDPDPVADRDKAATPASSLRQRGDGQLGGLSGARLRRRS